MITVFIYHGIYLTLQQKPRKNHQKNNRYNTKQLTDATLQIKILKNTHLLILTLIKMTMVDVFGCIAVYSEQLKSP